MPKTKPTAIDLFCGCGGTTQGLKDAGFRVIAGVEVDSLAVETFRKNHPNVKVWNCYIQDLSAKALMKKLGLKPGELDLLAGCPPCQAFSSMRRLNGNRRVFDRQSKDLIFEYLRFVRSLRPKVIMIENVPRLRDDYRFNDIRKSLRGLGYIGDPEIFNAADHGVPQRRRRMVFIASRVGEIEYAEALEQGRRLTVRDTIATMPRPGRSGDPLHDLPENRSKKVRRLIAKIPKNGGSRISLGREHQLECHKSCDGFKDVYGRMAWDEVAPTITGGCFNPSKGRFLHPSQNRTITLREAALLQSFPQNYFFSLERGKSGAAQMIGNAFPPRFVESHALQIREHLERISRN